MKKRPVVIHSLMVSLLALSAGVGSDLRAAETPAGDTGVQVLEERRWKFEFGNRRDPFAFSPKIDEVDIPAEPRVIKIAPSTYYAEAMNAFLESNKEDKVRETLTKCDAGLTGIAEDPNSAADPLTQELRERLLNLKKAAERVTLRKETERKFKTIDLRLTGIVKRDHSSQAIVNSRIVRKGDVVAAADQSLVVLEEIRANEVVVVFEGCRMLLNLAENQK